MIYFIKSRVKSFKAATNGLFYLLRTQVNFKIEIIISAIVIILGFTFQINRREWLFILIAIFFVLVSEAFNTSIELLCNKIDKETNRSIGLIKDISAAAVLISVVFSIIMGGIVFIPKLISIFK